MKPGYSTVEACKHSGLTFRQIDYWVRSGAIAPSLADANGSGSRRRWSDLDVARLTSIGQVVDGFAAFGVRQINTGVVEELWRGLRRDPDLVIQHGPVRIDVDLAEVST